MRRAALLALAAWAVSAATAVPAATLQLAAGVAVAVPDGWKVSARKPKMRGFFLSQGTDASDPSRSDVIGQRTVSGFEPLNRLDWSHVTPNDITLLQMLVAPVIRRGIAGRKAQVTGTTPLVQARFAGKPALHMTATATDGDGARWQGGVYVMPVSQTEQGVVFWGCRQGAACRGRDIVTRAAGH